MHIHMHTHTNTHTHIPVYTHARTHTYASTHTHSYYIHAFTCAHIFTHRNKSCRTQITFLWMQFNLQKQGSELLWTCPLNIQYTPVEWQQWVYFLVSALLCQGSLTKENWYFREPTLQGHVIPTSALRPNPLQVSINKSTQKNLLHQKWRRLKEQGKAPPSFLLIVVTKKSWVP